MPKDRDQLTPAEPDDLDKVAPEATGAISDDIAPDDAPDGAPLGASAGSGMPKATAELPDDEAREYR